MYLVYLIRFEKDNIRENEKKGRKAKVIDLTLEDIE